MRARREGGSQPHLRGADGHCWPGLGVGTAVGTQGLRSPRRAPWLENPSVGAPEELHTWRCPPWMAPSLYPSHACSPPHYTAPPYLIQMGCVFHQGQSLPFFMCCLQKVPFGGLVEALPWHLLASLCRGLGVQVGFSPWASAAERVPGAAGGCPTSARWLRRREVLTWPPAPACAISQVMGGAFGRQLDYSDFNTLFSNKGGIYRSLLAEDICLRYNLKFSLMTCPYGYIIYTLNIHNFLHLPLSVVKK